MRNEEEVAAEEEETHGNLRAFDKSLLGRLSIYWFYELENPPGIVHELKT